MQLPNGSGWPWRWTKKEKQDWKMVATTELMLALIKGVVNVGVVQSSLLQQAAGMQEKAEEIKYKQGRARSKTCYFMSIKTTYTR